MNRVSPGTMTVVIFAILIGLGGAFLVRQQMNQPQLPPLSDLKLDPKPQNIIVPVAGVDLEEGRKLTLHDVVLHSLTPEQFQKSRFAGQSFMRSTNQIFGRVLNQKIAKGAVFLPDNFYAEGFGPGVAGRLQPGFRAVTVPIQNVGVVQGFAAPGSMVDVLFRSEPEGQRPEVTMTLLEEVEVLALDNNVLEGQRVDVELEGTVTLSVTPAQAKVLKVVEGRGEITLTLRNPDEEFGDFEFAPVNLDNNEVRLGNGGLLSPVSFNSNVSSSATSSTSADAHSSMDMVLEDARQRVTLDDLLGIPSQPVKKTLSVYKAGAREVLEFEEQQVNPSQMLRKSGRVPTPIVGRRPRQPQNRETASLEYLP